MNIEEKLKNEMTAEQKLGTLLSIDRFLNAGISAEEEHLNYYKSQAIMEDEDHSVYNVQADTKGRIEIFKEIRDELDDLVIQNELEDFYDLPQLQPFLGNSIDPTIKRIVDVEKDITNTYNGLNAYIKGAKVKYMDLIEEEDWEVGTVNLGKYKAAFDTVERFEDLSIEHTMTIQQLRFLSLGKEILGELKSLSHQLHSNP